MSDPAESVDREVRQDVADLLVRYATGIDRRDWELFRTCFTEDWEADYGEIGLWQGVEEITEWMRVVHDACGHTLHRITNIAVSSSADLSRLRTGVLYSNGSSDATQLPPTRFSAGAVEDGGAV